MKITLIALFLACFSLQTASTQTAHPSLFVEGGGVTHFYSLNYSKPFFESGKWAGYFRIGAGIWDNTLAIPLGVTLVGSKNAHHPEITLAFGAFSEGLQFWNREESDLMLDLVLGLAYRYQPPGSAYYLSAGGFPYLRLDPTADTLSEKKAKLGFRPGFSVGKLF